MRGQGVGVVAAPDPPHFSAYAVGTANSGRAVSLLRRAVCDGRTTARVIAASGHMYV
jgi:hypothetical protein